MATAFQIQHMKACSRCGHRNDEPASRCAECGTEFLAPDSPTTDDAERLSDPDDDLRVLKKCATTVEAYLLKSRLEGAGIEACVPEEFTPQILWYCIPSPLEQVTVRVKARDYEAARLILTEKGGAPEPSPL